MVFCSFSWPSIERFLCILSKSFPHPQSTGRGKSFHSTAHSTVFVITRICSVVLLPSLNPSRQQSSHSELCNLLGCSCHESDVSSFSTVHHYQEPLLGSLALSPLGSPPNHFVPPVIIVLNKSSRTSTVVSLLFFSWSAVMPSVSGTLLFVSFSGLWI